MTQFCFVLLSLFSPVCVIKSLPLLFSAHVLWGHMVLQKSHGSTSLVFSSLFFGEVVIIVFLCSGFLCLFFFFLSDIYSSTASVLHELVLHTVLCDSESLDFLDVQKEF